jgi:hypothetical protein
MKTQKSRDETVKVIKETIEAVAEIGKSHITVRYEDISDDVKVRMESEGYTFEVLRDQLLPKGKITCVTKLYKISW